MGDPDKVLVIDVGGSNVKILATGQARRRKFASGSKMTARQMVDAVREQTQDWEWDAVSIGVPAAVRNGEILQEPVNLGKGWVGFDFAQAFEKPVRIVNDAAMQALGSYDGGRMLFMGLGTGLGTALIDEDHLINLELAHLPFREGTFEDAVGERALDALGLKRWSRVVFEVVEILRKAMVADYVVLGGGNVKKLDELPPHARRGSNKNAFTGGERLWR